MKEENPLDELFKKQLENRDIKPSEAVWERVEAGINSSNGNKYKGLYFMRAAVVTLLLGVSSWVYFSQHEQELIHIEPTTISNGAKVATEEQTPEKSKSEGAGNDEKKTESIEKPNTEAKPAKKQIVPIIRNSISRDHRFVEAEPVVPAVVEEEELIAEDEFEPEGVVLKGEASKPVMKLKYVPVTQKSFYAAKSEEEKKEKTGFKEKVLAYANDQFTNIINGEPVELPKTDTRKKTQLEINLGKLFKN